MPSCRHAVIILRVHFRRMIDQQFHHFNVNVSTSFVQWTKTITIPSLDLCPHENRTANLVEFTQLCTLQQQSASSLQCFGTGCITWSSKSARMRWFYDTEVLRSSWRNGKENVNAFSRIGSGSTGFVSLCNLWMSIDRLRLSWCLFSTCINPS